MAVYGETHREKPGSSYRVFIWFVQVIVVLLFCSMVIHMCLIAQPPTYTLADLTVPTTEGGNGFSVRESDEITRNNTSATVVFSLVITNPNKKKGVLHDETKVSLSWRGSVLGKSSLSSFYLSGRSSSTKTVLLNADRFVLGEDGALSVGLETKVRYRMLRWTTKRHYLNLEASVPVNQDGVFLIGKEGVKLKPIKR